MPSNPSADFIKAACVPLDAGHTSGTLDEAEAIRVAHPEAATGNIYSAAILGDEPTVRDLLAQDSSNAKAKGGPYGWDPLTYLCFSRYLRLDHTRSAGFVRTAEALLEAGASANTGFFSNEHQPTPEFESVLYGAAGGADQPEVKRVVAGTGAGPQE